MPDNQAVIVFLGAALLAGGREADAVALWNRRPEIAIMQLTRMANQYHQKGDVRRSAYWLDLAANFFLRPPTRDLFGLYFRACIVYREVDRLREALAACEALVTVAPEFGPSWLLLGRAYLQARNYDKAGKAVEKAVAKQPDYGPFYYYLGLAYEGQGRMSAALDSFSEAVQLAPTYGWVRLHLAELERARGHNAQALAHLRAAMNSEEAAVRQQAIRGLAELGVTGQ